MACFSPLEAYRLPGGGRPVFGKPPADRAYTRIQLPCNQCIGCRVDRSRAWAARCVHEAQLHEANSFITLTYRDEDLPEDHSVRVREWQLFAKRLRKRVGPFRFFACGEYGDQSLRPHYHALLFGQDFREDRELIREKPHKLYRSEVLDSVWRKGHASIGALTYETASYTARYCMKKINGDQAEEHYQRVDRDTGEVFQVQPEFVTMSRKPGLASEWFKKYRGDVYPHDDVVIDGRRHRPPRFYDDRLEESELRRLKVERRRRAVRRSADLTEARLKTRERIAKRKLANRERSI